VRIWSNAFVHCSCLALVKKGPTAGFHFFVLSFYFLVVRFRFFLRFSFSAELGYFSRVLWWAFYVHLTFFSFQFGAICSGHFFFKKIFLGVNRILENFQRLKRWLNILGMCIFGFAGISFLLFLLHSGIFLQSHLPTVCTGWKRLFWFCAGFLDSLL